MGFFEKIKSALQKTSDKISVTITGKKIDENLRQEIEDALILADVGVKSATELAQKVADKKFPKDATDIDAKKYLADEIETILKPYEFNFFNQDLKPYPYVILVIGVNGNGKTTTIAKIANLLKESGKNPLLVAADTFRAAAVEQLKYWAKKINADILCGKEKADPAGLVYSAMEYAKTNGNDVVLVDTAGRMQNRSDLLDELEKIKRVMKKIDNTAPHSTILVLDGITGQAAHSQVETFLNRIGIDGVIITKLDGSAKAGSIISLTEKYGIKVFAIGIGEAIDDLRPFNANEYAKALIGI
ncbi:MAG: signal recognition particle-docking protein FtsY [Alphaproteobacteria bacterium]|nr:signal recognition particle-docking protein FtsY [Alphaproteobacteria bacterium]